MNEAFENDSDQRDTANNISSSYGVRTVASTDEKIHVVFIVIVH